MSYFIVISGPRIDELCVDSGQLVPVAQAQNYVAALAQRIGQLDGRPCMFWDDGETLTSDEIVGSALEAGMRGHSIADTHLCKAVARCDDLKLTLRLWFADNDAEAFAKVASATGVKDAIALLAQSGRFDTKGIVMKPITA
jgi:hypothetical protein